MRIRIDLKIIIFAIIFFLTKQLKIYAIIMFFCFLHELGHIVNGDIGKTNKFVDDGTDEEKEAAADLFARDKIIDKDKYVEFVNGHDFSIEAIKQLAESQKVMPYMVIGRLQKEKYLDYKYFSKYKLRYKWAEWSAYG